MSPQSLAIFTPDNFALLRIRRRASTTDCGRLKSTSTFTIGIVIISGVAFSTLLSLFVVPAFYALLAPYTRSPDAVARKLEQLERDTPAVGGHA